jgi:hypothetical protein
MIGSINDNFHDEISSDTSINSQLEDFVSKLDSVVETKGKIFEKSLPVCTMSN